MEKHYQWKLASFAKKVDVNEAMQEFEKAENLYGKLVPETILEVAKNKKSKIHKIFTWDDSKAAHQYRLSQARTLINNVEVNYVSDGEERAVSVYEIVREDEGQRYKHIETLTYDEVAQVKDNTVRALNTLKIKLSVYKQFDTVVKHLDLALEQLS